MIYTLQNTHSRARELVKALLATNMTPVFDIDGVILDATHRVKFFGPEDVAQGRCTAEQVGALNVRQYRNDTTPEQVARDKTLPLYEVIVAFNKLQLPYHVATARVVSSCPVHSAQFDALGILPDALVCRAAKDNRPDAVIKSTGLSSLFSPKQLSSMVLLDDSLGNCKAARAIGMRALHVPFEGY